MLFEYFISKLKILQYTILQSILHLIYNRKISALKGFENEKKELDVNRNQFNGTF